jgi:hypothetical protein
LVIARGLFAWSAGAEEKMGVKFDGEGGSATACLETTPMPMVNNAMATVHAAVTKAFATVV